MAKAHPLSDGQLITFSNVALGVYTVTETLPGSGWVVSYSVPSGSLNLSTTTGLTQTLYITNTPPPPFASLQIAKLVTGGPNVTATFAVSLTGASGFSNSYGVSTSAATVITQLLQGAYTVTEQLATLPLPPFGYTWTTTSYTPTNGQITLTAGQTSYLTVTNALTLTIQRFGDRLWLESDSDGDCHNQLMSDPVSNHPVTATATMPVAAVYTTTTDSNGLYTFTVPAGTYSVTYGLPPIGYQASSSPGGNLISATSGGNDTSHANNSVVTLNPSDVITTVDFGFNLIPVPHLVVSKTANKSVVRAGDLVTYTITLINDGSGAANAVTVHDSLPTSVSYVSHSTSHGLFSVITGDWTIPVVPVGSETLTVTVQIR
ncbi:MAG: SdrD B-like domain-containing protein [Candidatus Nanopelagicales bacterium]